MIIMAIDHVRDFFHNDAMLFQPTDLARTTPILFFTRWITHFCAPVFAFTAGIGAYLWWQRSGRSKGELSRFLATRGLWLIFLEVTVMRVGYHFNVSLRFPLLLLVFWVLGLSMVVLAALVFVPVRLLAVLSVAVIALHNLLDPIRATGLWNFIHQPGGFPWAGTFVVVGYPLVPWFAVMSAGFCFGEVLQMDATTRRRITLWLGWAMTAAFVVIRAINVYGDPVRWKQQRSVMYTLLSFLNTTKYPPSLDFLLMTLGPALIALALLDRVVFSNGNPLIVFGRVPMFYFIVHFYAIHAASNVAAWIRYGSASYKFMLSSPPPMGGDDKLFPAHYGYDLWVVYIVWIVLVIALYPLCRWFSGIKARRSEWWLSYL